jgi:hypothetical protein
MTFRSWKLFQVTKNSYQEWRLEVSWGRFWTFSNSLSAKNRPVLAELLVVVFNNEIVIKIQVKKQSQGSQNHNLQSISQFHSSVHQFVVLFTSACQKEETKRFPQQGVCYITLSYPFFTLIYSQLVHRPKKERKTARWTKYQPSFCRTSFSNNLIKKRE